MWSDLQISWVLSICTVNHELESQGGALLGCRHLRLLAAPLPTPGTSSSSQTPSGQRSRPLSHIYEDNLAERGDKRKAGLTLHGVCIPLKWARPKQGKVGPCSLFFLLFVFTRCFAVEQTFFSCITSGCFISRWQMKCFVWHLSLTACNLPGQTHWNYRSLLQKRPRQHRSSTFMTKTTWF